MLAIHGIYDGKEIKLLEPIQVENPCRVVVTFLEPLKEETLTKDNNLEPFVGMWADFTPEEDRIFQTILEERSNYFTGREFDEEKST
jgi:hypothetical protein